MPAGSRWEQHDKPAFSHGSKGCNLYKQWGTHTIHSLYRVGEAAMIVGLKIVQNFSLLCIQESKQMDCTLSSTFPVL